MTDAGLRKYRVAGSPAPAHTLCVFVQMFSADDGGIRRHAAAQHLLLFTLLSLIIPNSTFSIRAFGALRSHRNTETEQGDEGSD